MAETIKSVMITVAPDWGREMRYSVEQGADMKISVAELDMGGRYPVDDSDLVDYLTKIAQKYLGTEHPDDDYF